MGVHARYNLSYHNLKDVHRSPRTTYFEKACELLCDIGTPYALAWMRIGIHGKQHSKHNRLPKRYFLKQNHLPWLSPNILQLLRKRNTLYIDSTKRHTHCSTTNIE